MPPHSPITVDLHMGILTEYDDDGFLGIGIDAFGEKASGLQPIEAHHPFGFMARPRDPDTAGGEAKLAVTVLRLSEGNAESGVVLGDPRATGKLAPLTKGSSRHYADTGGDDLPYVLLEGDDGSCVVHVPAGATSIRLEFAGGASVEVKASVVELGGAGGHPIVYETGSLAAYFAAASAAFTALGQTVAPPAGYTAAKATAL